MLLVKHRVSEFEEGDRYPRKSPSFSAITSSRFHAKATFPYTLSAMLASKLWMNKTDVGTIVQVIYEPKDRNSPDLLAYVKELVDAGNHIVSTVETR